MVPSYTAVEQCRLSPIVPVNRLAKHEQPGVAVYGVVPAAAIVATFLRGIPGTMFSTNSSPDHRTGGDSPTPPASDIQQGIGIHIYSRVQQLLYLWTRGWRNCIIFNANDKSC